MALAACDWAAALGHVANSAELHLHHARAAFARVLLRLAGIALTHLALHDQASGGTGGFSLTDGNSADGLFGSWAGVDLTRINGLGLAAVMKILSEVGPNLSRFANVKHFCSWLGLCPGTKISGGKVLSSKTKRSGNRVRQALNMAAMSLSHSDSALGAFYRRLCSRMDKPRANTATAHKLARMVYFMLTRGEEFVDKGQQHYEEQQRQRSIAALKRRAADLGFTVAPSAAVA